MKPSVLVSMMTLVTLAAAPAMAEPTEVTVHVIAKGAKFIGTSMGGVDITIRDADSGAILAHGVTRGTTGDTRTIMQTPAERGQPLSTPDAARFSATLDLAEPRLVEITALGPRAQRQSAARASVTQWLVPGKHVTGGDGVLIELPGLIVDVLAPAAHTQTQRSRSVRIDANVAMMCGCPITPGGLWDANAITVAARIEHDGARLAEVPLRYAGKASQFTGSFTPAKKGAYQIVIYAYQPATGNTGVDMTTIVVD